MEKTIKQYHRHNYIISSAFNQMQQKISSSLHASDKQKEHPESYWFIPHETNRTIEQLILAHDYLTKKKGSTLYSGQLNFLDAGCALVILCY